MVSGLRSRWRTTGKVYGPDGTTTDVSRLGRARGKVAPFRQRRDHYRLRTGLLVRAHPLDGRRQSLLLRLRGRPETARPLAPAPVRPGRTGDDSHLGIRARRLSAPRWEHALSLGVWR